MIEKKQTDEQDGGGGLTGNAANPRKEFTTQEKTSIGGAFNSGVTSDNDEEKDRIEKKASLCEDQPLSDNEKKQQGT